MPTPRLHGSNIRGLDTTPRSSSFEGVFGRLFRTLLPAFPPATTDPTILKAFKDLAQKMTAEAEGAPTEETQVDDEENQGIDAGYTYLGQFIDHDLTFDPASSLQKKNDPNALVNFRTPRFDLDNVYGRGPDDQPYMYDANGMKFLLGRPLHGHAGDPRAHDVPRSSGDPARAIIGDPRNDENVIVSQIQSSFLRFHNRMVDIITAEDPNASFADIQQEVRWHYQWVVLHDFLPTIVGQELVNKILPKLATKGSKFEADVAKPDLKFYKFKEAPYIPVEFSVAAYRFGHSMVRPIYRLNATAPRLDIFSDNPDTSLTGFHAFIDQWAIDWHLFFDPDKTAPLLGSTRIQKAYKIDPSLVNPLGKLPPSVGGNVPSLAERNLLRGLRMGLPSGQAVACQMGITPLSDQQLKVGKANTGGFATNQSITGISPRFKNNAPLWYYILAESLHFVEEQATKVTTPDPKKKEEEQNALPVVLGPVGGRIVAEVFIGLLYGDSHSYVIQNPHWTPRLAKNGKFQMFDLLMEANKV